MCGFTTSKGQGPEEVPKGPRKTYFDNLGSCFNRQLGDGICSEETIGLFHVDQKFRCIKCFVTRKVKEQRFSLNSCSQFES